MKLRNKKTGEIIILKDEGEIALLKLVESSLPNGLSLWEEVKEEPLIKDEKIRKAVRAWAEVDGIDAVEIVSKYQLISLDEQSSIEFFAEIYPDYVHNEEHTIAELCGEEEESGEEIC